MSSLGKGLRWLLILLAICAVVWTVTIIWWQESRRAVDEADVVLFIVLLPLALFAVVLGIRWGWRLFTRTPTVAAVPVAAGAIDTEAVAAAAESRWSMTVIASTFNCAAGTDGETLQAAALARKDLVKLSKSVFDGDGFRVPQIAVDDLDISSSEAWRQALLKQSDSISDAEDSETARLDRCLALLGPPLEETLLAVADWLTPPLPSEFPKPIRPSAVAPAARSRPSVSLRTVLLFPPDFSDAARSLCKRYVETQLIDAARHARASTHLEVSVITEPAQDIRVLDALMVRAHSNDADDVWLLIGVDSMVDDETLSQRERRDRVRTARKPHLPAAGEGAFVLALTTLPITSDRPPALAQLHRPAMAARSLAVSEHGKVTFAALQTALHAAITHADVPPATITRVIADVHGYNVRSVEAAGAMTALFDELDAVADRDDLGLLLGDIGVARVPGLLALATANVAASGKPCIVAGLADALDRFGLVLLPPPESDLRLPSTSTAAASASS